MDRQVWSYNGAYNQRRGVMVYTLAIDWLSFYCEKTETLFWETRKSDGQSLFGRWRWGYQLLPYGSRQYKKIVRITLPNPQGGIDEVAEVQDQPCSNILLATSCIVKFHNRVLYQHDCWEVVGAFLRDHKLNILNVSRLDLAADFNQFATMTPLRLIQEFASSELRHVGRGVGATYFKHGATKNVYTLEYTGLSFGTHSSDKRVYLYNKSFELDTQGDKPWIKDLWRSAGLDVSNVWRLEVSIKSKAMHFIHATTGDHVHINSQLIGDKERVSAVYHAFVNKLFAFVVNRQGITNISREQRIRLFNNEPAFVHKTIRNVSASSRSEKILIKALWHTTNRYRGSEIIEDEGVSKGLAYDIAKSVDLLDWLIDKSKDWETPIHK